jgi:thiamine biosynthesis lipoprotein
MGVKTTLTVYAPNRETAEKACAAAFGRIADLEQIMSDYRPTSELMRLCAKADGPPVKVSPELFFVLEKAQMLSARSRGAFDVTVGPLVKLWRAARKQGRLPDPVALRSAKILVGWRKVRLNAKNRTVQLQVPGMLLDLGGIAKGYAGDEAIRVLRGIGIRRAMFEAGGDILTGDPPPGRKGWLIQIGTGTASGEKGSKPWKWVWLHHHAISSSGDTEQYVEIGGVRYSHIVDPHTGLGLTQRIGVTVIAPQGILSDGLSTTLSVLGRVKGRSLIHSFPGVYAYFHPDLKPATERRETPKIPAR